MDNIIKKRIRFWHILHLPLWWYSSVANQYIRSRTLAKHKPSEFYIYNYCACLSICFNDRSYLDEVVDETMDERIGKANIPAQIYCGIGMALFDLGYKSEGLSYLEKASKCLPSKLPSSDYVASWCLCVRLNRVEEFDRRLELAQKLTSDFPDNANIEGLLAKAYIDKDMIEKASDLLPDLVKRGYGFLVAEIEFAKGNFESAADAFEKYKFPDLCHSWRPQYDYKKALAFYYSGQKEKWQRQSLKIRRRLEWDRFYKIDDIENEGIKREPAIDAIINSNEPDRHLVDTERTGHYLKVFVFIAKIYIIRHRFAIPIVIILLYCLYDFLKRTGITKS